MTREFKRERGFLTFAQNGHTDYLRMAYALALSLKASQSIVPHLSVAITPGMAVPDQYRAVFDEVIDVPWRDEAEDAAWKLENEWKAYHVTPYRETIKLDADMLFPRDITEWWTMLARQDMLACTNVETYRGETITSDHCRKVFTASGLPNVYTGFMFFRHSDVAQEVFRLAEIIFHNWEHFFFKYLEAPRPDHVSTDVVFALAIKLAGLVDECTYDSLPAPRFVHMKSALQNWPEDADEDWTRHVPVGLSPDLDLSIGTYRQALPFHYHHKAFLTDEMIATYERKLGL